MFEGSEVIERISFSIYYNSKINFVTATWYNKKNVEIGEILDDFNFRNEEDASKFFKAITEKLKNDGFNIIDLPKPPKGNDFYETFYIEI